MLGLKRHRTPPDEPAVYKPLDTWGVFKAVFWAIILSALVCWIVAGIWEAL